MQMEVIPAWRDTPFAPDLPDSFNDDLFLSAFRPSSFIWAGEQRKGIQFNTPYATSKTNHVDRDLSDPFRHTADVQLPGELAAALEFIHRAPSQRVRSIWQSHLGRIALQVGNVAEIQDGWDSAIPELIRPSGGFDKTSALSALMRRYGLGGQCWIMQFIFGFWARGAFPQRGGFPMGQRASSPEDIDTIWPDADSRLSSRVRSSGIAHGQHLRDEASAHVGVGWLVNPARLGKDGQFLGCEGVRINTAFLSPSIQLGTVRARGAMKCSRLNACAADVTPENLPPSGSHLSDAH